MLLKSLSDFKYLLSALVLSGLAIALAVITQGDVKAVIGNQAYTVGFFLFAIYISLYLFFQTKLNGVIYFSANIIYHPAFLMANITGAVIGLGASIIVALILIALLYKKTWSRLGAGVLALLMIVTVAITLIYPNQAWIKIIRYYLKLV